MFASLEDRVLRQYPTMSDTPTSTPVHCDIAEITCATARAATQVLGSFLTEDSRSAAIEPRVTGSLQLSNRLSVMKRTE